MKVLVINSGSSSLKYDLFDLDSEESIIKGTISRIGLEGSTHEKTRGGTAAKSPIAAPDHAAALQAALAAVAGGPDSPLTRLADVAAVAHRIGHGGNRYRSPVVIDNDVKDEIRRFIPVMPLHHPAMLAGIEACQAQMPSIPQVAVFDTAFHHAIPDEAAIYGLPYEYFDQGIRKYGFHGNSHEYVAGAAAAFLERPLKRLNIISCHLGNGASICAIQQGQSIDTTMGFSPLPGLIMGTRAGDLDPAIIPYLARTAGMGIDDIDDLMNRKGGLLGISGLSSDMRELLAAAEEGNARALLAIKAFCYRIRCYIGWAMAAMGGADALVFTGGIGQNSRGIRFRSVQGLERLGIAIDPILNDRCQVGDDAPVADISARHALMSVLVVATNEELMIARQCARALDYHRSIRHTIFAEDPRPIRVSTSAHHVHLARRDIDILFGPGHQLTPRAPLYIDSEFASKETVSLVGPRGRVDSVRILGPERGQTQVEIARTEEFKLGLDAPIRMSGDLKNTPGITLEGPAGNVVLAEGVICAIRHIHMAPPDAEQFGVRDGDRLMVRIKGERELIFGDVVARVSPKYKLEMHIDTDEANAAELSPVSEGFLVRIESRQ